MDRSIVLIGPMGAGKTTLGKKLSKEFDLPFFDTDRLISSRHGSIESIFKKHGEAHFRELETGALTEALRTPGIVATGGGAPMRPENQALLREHFVVFLDTAQEFVIGKINLDKRPLIRDNPDRWTEIYEERKDTYANLASATVFTGGKPIRALMSELEEVVQSVL